MITCNDLPVTELRLTLPVVGAWVAEIEADSDEVLSGAVELVDDGITYSGVVVRAGVSVGSCRAMVVGGGGGLSADVTARSYNGMAARSVLADMLAVMGEQLDQTSNRALLSTVLPYWTRAAERGGVVLSSLADALGARWRVLANGKVWLGTETWPVASKAQEALEIDNDGVAGSVLLAPDAITLVPGVVLAGLRVGRVEHRVGRDVPLRTTFWIEP